MLIFHHIISRKKNTMNEVYVEQFGAVGDGTTDDRAAIQAAIDFCIASSDTKTVKFKPRTYRINGPLICAKISAGAYSIFNLCISGAVNANAGVTNQCTKIVANFTDTFAIGFQNARSCTVENLLILGGRPETKTTKQIFESTASDWVIAGVRDTQYSPYAGIVVDPFGTSVPSDGGYPGLSSYYMASAGGSSGISVRNCYITNFTVGFIISPNGVTPNAESINVYNSRIYLCKSAWCSGQSQTRNCRLVDSAIFYALNAIDTISYGAGTGSAATIDSLVISRARNCFNVSTSRGNVDGRFIYAEDIWKIGVISGAKIASFSNSTFKFTFGGDIVAPDTLLSGGGTTYFNDCDFTKPGDASWNASFRNQTVYISGGILDCLNVPYGSPSIDGASVFSFLVATKEIIGGTSPFYNYHGSRIRKLGNNNTTFLDHHIRANANSSVLLEASVPITVSGDSVTFTLASVSKVRVGDIIYSDKSGFYFLDYTNNNNTTANVDNLPYIGTVSSIVGNNVTLKNSRINLTSGNYNLYSSWSDKYLGGIIGSTTNNSNVITNVYKENATSLVGYRIYSADYAMFPFGLYVVSEDTNARTLTLSGNLNATIGTVFLYTAFFTIDCVVSVAPSGITNLYVEKGTIIRTRSQSLTDKTYFVSSAGVVGNATHTPIFKEITIA